MEYFAAIDVSLELSSVCVVDGTGKIVREAKVASEPAALIALFDDTGFEFTRIGLEADPLSQWLHAGLTAAGLPAILIETRHVKMALKAMTVKTDRNDARGTVQLLVPSGACQDGAGAGDPGAVDRTEAAAGQATGYRAGHSRSAARFWPEGRSGQQGPVRGADRGGGDRASDAGTGCGGDAAGAGKPARGVRQVAPDVVGQRAR